MPVPPCSDWSLRDPRRLARIIAVNAWLMDLEARIHRGEWGVRVIMLYPEYHYLFEFSAQGYYRRLYLVFVVFLEEPDFLLRFVGRIPDL